jgi:hypothetical protein
MYSLIKLDRLGKHTFDVLNDKTDRLIREGAFDLESIMKTTSSFTIDTPDMRDKLFERLQIVDSRMGGDERFSFH